MLIIIKLFGIDSNLKKINSKIFVPLKPSGKLNIWNSVKECTG